MFDSTLVSMMCMHAQSCLTLCNPMDRSLPGPSFPWNFPDKNTAVGCHFLLQEIFQTQGLNPSLLRLLRCRQSLYHSATGGALWLFRPQAAGGSGPLPPLHQSARRPPPQPTTPRPRRKGATSYLRQGDCENEILAMGPEMRGTGF